MNQITIVLVFVGLTWYGWCVLGSAGSGSLWPFLNGPDELDPGSAGRFRPILVVS